MKEMSRAQRAKYLRSKPKSKHRRRQLEVIEEPVVQSESRENNDEST